MENTSDAIKYKNILSQLNELVSEKENELASITEDIYEFVRIWNEENNIMNGDELTETQDIYLKNSIRDAMTQKDAIMAEINSLYYKVSELNSFIEYLSSLSQNSYECTSFSRNQFRSIQGVIDMRDYQ